MFVGNDIVAYKHIRCLGKWQNEKFLGKILQPSEIKHLELQVNKDAYLWTLWTLKEAAYKLSCFLGNRKKFHPIQFSVLDTSFLSDSYVQNIELPCTNLLGHFLHNYYSVVQFENNIFFCKTLITHQFVHSLVMDKLNETNCIWAIGHHHNYNKNDYSAEVRNFAMQELKEQNIFFNAIEKDKDGIPFIVSNETAQYISLSHDQQFVSFAYRSI